MPALSAAYTLTSSSSHTVIAPSHLSNATSHVALATAAAIAIAITTVATTTKAPHSHGRSPWDSDIALHHTLSSHHPALAMRPLASLSLLLPLLPSPSPSPLWPPPRQRTRPTGATLHCWRFRRHRNVKQCHAEGIRQGPPLPLRGGGRVSSGITVPIHCDMHTALINTNMIYIFDVNEGNWGRACSLLVTTSNDECALSEGATGGRKKLHAAPEDRGTNLPSHHHCSVQSRFVPPLFASLCCNHHSSRNPTTQYASRLPSTQTWWQLHAIHPPLRRHRQAQCTCTERVQRPGQVRCIIFLMTH